MRVVACRQMTHTLFEQQGGKGVSLDRFRQFLARLQDGMLKLEFAHYDWQGETSQQSSNMTVGWQPLHAPGVFSLHIVLHLILCRTLSEP